MFFSTCSIKKKKFKKRKEKKRRESDWVFLLQPSSAELPQRVETVNIKACVGLEIGEEKSAGRRGRKNL